MRYDGLVQILKGNGKSKVLLIVDDSYQSYKNRPKLFKNAWKALRLVWNYANHCITVVLAGPHEFQLKLQKVLDAQKSQR